MPIFDLKDPALRQYIGTSVEKAARAGVVSAGARIVAHIVNELIPSEPRVPVDRGAYRAGWRSEPTPEGVEIYNVAPHAPFIEYGVRSQNVKIGRQMLEDLARWVVRKGIGTSAEAPSIAFAIAKSMQKRGIFNEGKGLRILERAMKLSGEFLIEEIADAIEEAFNG